MAAATATATASTATIWLVMPTICVPSDSTTESGRWSRATSRFWR